MFAVHTPYQPTKWYPTTQTRRSSIDSGWHATQRCTHALYTTKTLVRKSAATFLVSFLDNFVHPMKMNLRPAISKLTLKTDNFLFCIQKYAHLFLSTAGFYVICRWRDYLARAPYAYTTGVGLLSCSLVSSFSSLYKTPVSYWISRLYFMGVAAAQLRWHLPNINDSKKLICTFAISKMLLTEKLTNGTFISPLVFAHDQTSKLHWSKQASISCIFTSQVNVGLFVCRMVKIEALSATW